MKAYDRASGLFWFLLSLGVFIQSLRMGIGTLQNPGMGFMAFGASGIMGILSAILVVKTFRGGRQEAASPFAGLLIWRLAFVVISILLYIILVPYLGYILSTFVLLAVFLFGVGKRKVWLLIVFPGLTSVVTYYVFSKLLNCQFPQGLLWF